MSAPPPPARGGMSLYANLLESNADSSASISRDPVRFRQDDPSDSAAVRKALDPALRFQPIRRPQAKQANKPKPAFPKAPTAPAPAHAVSAAAAPPATTSGSNAQSAAGTAAAPGQPRNTLADWAATEEDEYLYGAAEKRQRGGRRRKRKKVEDTPLETDWDELYDPARPTNVEEYLRSEERIREVREWKDVLYAHRRRRAGSDDSEMAGSDERGEDADERKGSSGLGAQFAPPGSLSFAPPPMSPPRRAVVAEAATGDDAYARRLALSGMAPAPPSPPPPPPEDLPAEPSATISRAPVRYEAPPPRPPATNDDEMDLDDDDDDDEVNYANIPPPPLPLDTDADADADSAERSTARPGQAGFAARLMAKYGWTKGTGLGADASGITTALRVQVEKRRKRPDAEGGGFAEPGGRGKIIASTTSKNKNNNKNKNEKDEEEEEEEEGGGAKFGKTSQVIVLRNMLEGMPDLEAEVEAGLGQEIGEECGEKYGRVERLYIEPRERLVFIKFTDQVSALRAVNALEGRIFNGNAIAPRFYNLDKFENGVYS